MTLPRRDLTYSRCQLHSHSFPSRSTPASTVVPEARDGEEKPGSASQGGELEATRVSNRASWLESYVIATPPKMSTRDSASSGTSKWAWVWACLVFFVIYSPSATEAKFIEGYLKTAEVRNVSNFSPFFFYLSLPVCTQPIYFLHMYTITAHTFITCLQTNSSRGSLIQYILRGFPALY